MALDAKARKIAINFAGGSLTATRGLLEAIFGTDLAGTANTAVTTTVSVSGHSRQRVIGGPATNVAANSYTSKRYPTTASGGAAGGEPLALLVSGKYWTARLSGSHQAFAAFLQGASISTTAPLFWRSEKGTQYGPFGG